MIEFIDVSKKFDHNYIIQNATFKMENPGLYIFNGANGSGKSTILKLITGLIYKTEGKITINSKLSYLPDKYTMPKLTRVKSYLSCLVNDKAQVLSLIGKYQIPNKLITDLSKGNQQKLGILQSLLIDADCYIYDEPLDGLDDFAKKQFKESITELINNNKIVIMTLHNKTFFNDLKPIIYEVKDGRVSEKKKKS